MSGIEYDYLHDTETRVTDEASGGQKGQKLTQLGALDPVALIEVARVAGFGANKYEAFNFLRGYDWVLSFNAGMRHALLFWSGEDRDQESGQLHSAMAAWHFLTLTSFLLRAIGRDTRPPALEPAPEGTFITREALDGLVAQVPGLSIEWQGGMPVVMRECHE